MPMNRYSGKLQRMNSKDIAHTLSDAFAIVTERIDIVQPLWSGYGAIARYWTKDALTPCIAKIINVHAIPQHPRGWSGETSHQRKLSSFINEQRFYKAYSTQLMDIARIPQYIKATHSNEAMVLLLEDVDAQGFAKRLTNPSVEQLQTCLAWLAALHAYFLRHSLPDTLWARGNYWHLATRQDEFEQMADSELKQHAHLLDQMLANARYQTLLHGDAKIANFCFSDEACLALDFQYVGAGVGIVDVMYFLGSCLSEHDLENFADDAFDCYFAHLAQALGANYCNTHWSALEAEWRALIPIAWADFSRFLEGWSPSHHKLHGYSARQTRQGLKYIQENDNLDV